MKLKRLATMVGAEDHCHLRLVSSTVSQHHALIIHGEDVTYIRDLASRNKIVVNDLETDEAVLKDGDQVRVGKFLFEFNSGGTGNRREQAVRPGAVKVGKTTVPIRGRMILIGRRVGSDLRLPQESVSNCHAVIFQADGARYVRDLNSRTGTYLNGQKVHQSEIRVGDQIRVGGTSIQLVPGDTLSPGEDLPEIIEEPRALVQSHESDDSRVGDESHAAQFVAALESEDDDSFDSDAKVPWDHVAEDAEQESAEEPSSKIVSTPDAPASKIPAPKSATRAIDEILDRDDDIGHLVEHPADEKPDDELPIELEPLGEESTADDLQSLEIAPDDSPTLAVIHLDKEAIGIEPASRAIDLVPIQTEAHPASPLPVPSPLESIELPTPERPVQQIHVAPVEKFEPADKNQPDLSIPSKPSTNGRQGGEDEESSEASVSTGGEARNFLVERRKVKRIPPQQPSVQAPLADVPSIAPQEVAPKPPEPVDAPESPAPLGRALPMDLPANQTPTAPAKSDAADSVGLQQIPSGLDSDALRSVVVTAEKTESLPPTLLEPSPPPSPIGPAHPAKLTVEKDLQDESARVQASIDDQLDAPLIIVPIHSIGVASSPVVNEALNDDVVPPVVAEVLGLSLDAGSKPDAFAPMESPAEAKHDDTSSGKPKDQPPLDFSRLNFQAREQKKPPVSDEMSGPAPASPTVKPIADFQLPSEMEIPPVMREQDRSRPIMFERPLLDLVDPADPLTPKAPSRDAASPLGLQIRPEDFESPTPIQFGGAPGDEAQYDLGLNQANLHLPLSASEKGIDRPVDIEPVSSKTIEKNREPSKPGLQISLPAEKSNEPDARDVAPKIDLASDKIESILFAPRTGPTPEDRAGLSDKPSDSQTAGHDLSAFSPPSAERISPDPGPLTAIKRDPSDEVDLASMDIEADRSVVFDLPPASTESEDASESEDTGTIPFIASDEPSTDPELDLHKESSGLLAEPEPKTHPIANQSADVRPRDGNPLHVADQTAESPFKSDISLDVTEGFKAERPTVIDNPAIESQPPPSNSIGAMELAGATDPRLDQVATESLLGSPPSASMPPDKTILDLGESAGSPPPSMVQFPHVGVPLLGGAGGFSSINVENFIGGIQLNLKSLNPAPDFQSPSPGTIADSSEAHDGEVPNTTEMPARPTPETPGQNASPPLSSPRLPLSEGKRPSSGNGRQGTSSSQGGKVAPISPPANDEKPVRNEPTASTSRAASAFDGLGMTGPRKSSVLSELNDPEGLGTPQSSLSDDPITSGRSSAETIGESADGVVEDADFWSLEESSEFESPQVSLTPPPAPARSVWPPEPKVEYDKATMGPRQRVAEAEEAIIAHLLADALPPEERHLDPRDLSAAPHMPRRRRLIPFLMLGMVFCLGAVLVTIHYMLPAHSHVTGSLTYLNVDWVANTIDGDKFEASQRRLLESDNVRENAIAMFEQQHPGLSLGFLIDGTVYTRASQGMSPRLERVNDVPQTVVRTTFEGNDPSADKLRMMSVLDALINANSKNSEGSHQQQQRIDRAGRQVEEVAAEIEQTKARIVQKQRIVDQQPSSEELARLKSREQELGHAYMDADEAVRSDRSALENLQSGPAMPGQGPTTLPSDADLDKMRTQLADLTSQLQTAKDAQALGASRARQQLEDALQQFNDELSSADGVLDNSSQLRQFVNSAKDSQSKARQLINAMIIDGEDLEKQLEDTRRDMQELIHTLQQQKWAADPKLKDLQDKLAIAEHQYNATVGQGITDPQVGRSLGQQVEIATALVHARQEQLRVDPSEIKVAEGLNKVIDWQKSRLTKEKGQIDEMLDPLEQQFRKLDPVVARLPDAQQEMAKGIRNRLSMLNEARQQYADAVGDGQAAPSALVTELQKQIDDLRASCDRRQEVLSAQMPRNLDANRVQQIADAQKKLAVDTQARDMANTAYYNASIEKRDAIGRDEAAQAARAEKADLTEQLTRQQTALETAQHDRDQLMTQASGLDIKPLSEADITLQTDNRPQQYELIATIAIPIIFGLATAILAMRTSDPTQGDGRRRRSRPNFQHEATDDFLIDDDEHPLVA